MKESSLALVRVHPGRSSVMALAHREVLRFLRQRNRVIGALGQPILFWLLFGAGMNRMFQAENQSFAEYFFPGTLVLILMFTAIFATISIIEDRREGFLQGVLVAPTPRWAVVLGKVFGGSILAVGQGILFLLLSFTIGLHLNLISVTLLLIWMILSSIALTAFGFLLAWPMESTQGFHAIMNLLLMPMWLLSGAFFPIPTLSQSATRVEWGMHWLMRINPVTYIVGGLRRLMYWTDTSTLGPDQSAGGVWVPSLATSTIFLLAFTILALAAATYAARRTSVAGQ